MGLPDKYNQMFVDYTNSHAGAYNDGDRYDVTITRVADPTQPHWRVLGIHHLDGHEGGGNNVYIDIIDENNRRIFGAVAEARNVNGFVEQLRIHKDRPDHGADTVLFGNDTKSIRVTHNGLPSDAANNFHTRHANEFDEHGNPTPTTFAHHAFYLVFQFSAGVAQSGGQNGSGGATEPAGPDGAELEALLWATGQPLVQEFSRDAALYKKAQADGLGEHLTPEYEILHHGQAYLAQIFELGLVYAPAGQWDQVQVLESGTRSGDALSPDNILWDHHITGFFGSRWAYFEQNVQSKIPSLTWTSFNETFTQLNPFVTDDKGAILPQKIYTVPRLAGQPASPAIQPAEVLAQPAANGAVAALAAASGTGEAAVALAAIPPDYVQVVNGRFQINGQPKRFIGANIRGLVHYGHLAKFPGDPNTLRRQQLQAAKEMNAQLIRVFLPQKHTGTQDVIARLRETINLFNAEFPDMYLLPALTDLYIDAEFFVKDDDHFYETQTQGGKQILNHKFFKDGYKDQYEKFVKDVVTAFKNEPRIFAWEIGNELKVEKANDLSDEQAAQLLVNFMTKMARQIKTWDPRHLVTTGMISTRHAFMPKQSSLRDNLYSSAHINFITIHPYNGNNRLPHEMGAPEIPVEDDMDLARRFGKPLIVEEAGFDKNHFANRPEKTRDDIAYWFGEGASCYMPWGFQKPEIGDGDNAIGITASDFDELYTLHRKCGEILAQHGIADDIREAIRTIDFHVKELESDLIWPIIVDGFDFPVGKPDGTGYFVAAGLVDPQYRVERGFWHTGEDWNGVKGGDSDLGDPVFAAAHGLVITAQPFNIWGNIVLLEHVMPTGQKVWSQYAHLKDMFVKRGDIIRRGELVGTIGKGGNNQFLAHLHFEIRLRNLPASKDGWKTEEDRETVLRSYAHPTNFIKSFRPR